MKKLLLLTAIISVFASCQKEDDIKIQTTTPVKTLDGLYISIASGQSSFDRVYILENVTKLSSLHWINKRDINDSTLFVQDTAYINLVDSTFIIPKIYYLENGTAGTCGGTGGFYNDTLSITWDFDNGTSICESRYTKH